MRNGQRAGDGNEESQSSNLDLEEKKSRFGRMLLLLTVALWICGLVTLATGTWTYASRIGAYDSYVPRLHRVSALMMMGAGAAVSLSGPFGLCGFLLLRHGMICVFSYVLFLASVLEIGSGAIAVTFASKTKVLIAERLVNDLKSDVRFPATDEVSKKVMDMQRELQCCGGHSYGDWVDSRWWRSRRRDLTSVAVAPESCCVDARSKPDCNAGQPPFRQLAHPELIYKVGCLDVLSRERYIVSMVSGVTALICGILMSLGFFGIHYSVNAILEVQEKMDAVKVHCASRPVRIGDGEPLPSSLASP